MKLDVEFFPFHAIFFLLGSDILEYCR